MTPATAQLQTLQPDANPVAGIAAMSAAMAFFIFSDVFTKLASAALSVGKVIAIRGLISTLTSCCPQSFSPPNA